MISKIAIQALKDGVKKWRDIAKGTVKDYGEENCAMCKLADKRVDFLSIHKIYRGCCSLCTIKCHDIYAEWGDHQSECHGAECVPYSRECEECERIAVEMAEYIESFIPKEVQ